RRASGREDELVAELELQPVQRLGLELPDALARQAELLADRLERGRLAAEAEAELDDPALPFGQVCDRALDALAAHRVDRVVRLDDVLRLEARGLGQLVDRGLAAELRLQLRRGAVQLDPPLLDVHRDANRLRLIRDGALAGLADPPGRIGRELVALAPVELL